MLDKAKSLLTKAEKQFFDSSFGAALAKHTQAQVQAAVKQARILRNKWRDLSQSQARTVKRAGRATDSANARTRDKHDLLADVVTRFEKRLREFETLVAEATGVKKPAAAKGAAKKSAAKSAKAAAKPAAKRVSRPTVASKKASGRVTSGLPAPTGTQLVSFDRSKQRSAAAAAKASRIARGGQGTQRLGHVAASGRRAQRRRDIHSRG